MEITKRTGVVSPQRFRETPRRVEGRDKVTGRALFVNDHSKATLHMDLDAAYIVTSHQATGSIISIDTRHALSMRGVRAVMTHENAPRLHKVMASGGNEIVDILPLQDNKLHYAGQCVAVVIADTLENARTAALFITIEYSKPESSAAFTLDQVTKPAKEAKTVGSGDKGIERIGDAEKAFGLATHRVDLEFNTSPHHHNAMEPAGIVAVWGDEGSLTVYVPTQFTYGDALILGEAFEFPLKDRLPRILAQVLTGIQFNNNVRVISPLVGGAFGGKAANIHLLLAPMAAKLSGRPVKLMLTREQTYTLQPFRGASRQRLRLGATVEGKLEAVLQDALMAQGAGGSYIEPTVESTTKLYACKNMHVESKSSRLDTNAPGWMRGPGSCLGQFALEVAMDELAEKVGIDPLTIRLLNYSEVDPSTGHEWSSKALRECYKAAAEHIGWADRNSRVGSMREGRSIVGLGMATSIYATRQLPAIARIILAPDGHATVQTSLQEIGQGAITSMTQVAAQHLGLPLECVHLEWGDTALPYGSMNFGSMGTLSSGAVILEAADAVAKTLFKRVVKDAASPLYGQHQHDLEIIGLNIVGTDGATESVLRAVKRLDEAIDEEVITGRTMGHSAYGRSAFGAQFVKVLVDPDTMHVQVDRLVGAFAGGQALNPVIVRSQLIGGMVWGVGQALIEESMIDLRTGLWMNGNLGEALVPVNADIANIEAIIMEEDDSRGHPLSAKGLGEIGVVGTAAAISNAIYHATGQRLRSLPMKVDHLIRSIA